MSPEQHRGLPYSSKADMWAVGCVLCEVMTNGPAWEAASREELAEKHALGAYAAPPTFYSPFLRRLVAELLSADPGRRPRAREVLCRPEMAPAVARCLGPHLAPAEGRFADPFACHAAREQCARLEEQGRRRARGAAGAGAAAAAPWAEGAAPGAAPGAPGRPGWLRWLHCLPARPSAGVAQPRGRA